MSKNKKHMAQKRAQKRAQMGARRKSARSAGGNRFAHLGCTVGELRRAPVYAAYIGETVFNEGIGEVVIARTLPDGRIAAAYILVDAYCLGVKNAFLRVESRAGFDRVIENQRGTHAMKRVPAAQARKLVEAAIAYARDLGFEPHRDYRAASIVLGDIDPAECDLTFTFGKNGKPFYISGPNDSAAMSQRVVARLRDQCGPDGAHYLIRLRDPSLPEAFDSDDNLFPLDDDESE